MSSMVWRRFQQYFCVRLIPQNSMFSNFCHVLKSGDYDFLLKIYTRDMKSYQKFLLRILGDLDCIGSLNSSFVLDEVKNPHKLPLPEI